MYLFTPGIKFMVNLCHGKCPQYLPFDIFLLPFLFLYFMFPFLMTDGSDSEILFHGLLIYLSLELGLYGGFESEGEDAQAHDAR